MRYSKKHHNGITYQPLRRFRLFRNKYKLLVQYSTQTKILGYNIDTCYIKLTPDGILTLRVGYEWDGPSGISVDTENFMRGSLGHDPGYKLLRLGLLPYWAKAEFDSKLFKDCRKDGMSKFRASYVFKAVNKHGDSSALPDVDL